MSEHEMLKVDKTILAEVLLEEDSQKYGVLTTSNEVPLEYAHFSNFLWTALPL